MDETTATPTWRELVAAGDLGHPLPWSAAAEARVDASWEALRRLIAGGTARVYGLHTGFGADVDAPATHDAAAHQLGLLDSLCVGAGPPLPLRVVRRALRLQAFKVGQGFSGTHPQTVQRLRSLADQTELPRVPSWGSLGASGDLIPMAHAVAPLFVDAAGSRQVPGPRDVLSLVNTNAMMASWGVELTAQVDELTWRQHLVTAAATLALGFDDEPFRRDTLDLPGQDPFVLEAGEQLSKAMHATADRLAGHLAPVPHRPLQARYSIRCAPQVLGGARWSLDTARERLTVEALRVADNPIIRERPDGPRALHGGHFYALGIAHAADLLGDALFRVVELADRQVLLLMDPTTSGGLPRNLEAPGRANVKGLHQLVSSLGQRLRALSMPSRLSSFSSESNNQDVVPCGLTALLSVQDQLDVASEALRAAELIVERALVLRAGRPVPPQLGPEGWLQGDPRRGS